MNGKTKRNIEQVCGRLGVFKHSVQNTFYPSCNESDLQNNRIVTLKKIIYFVLIFITFLMFTNKVSAYSLNDYSSYENFEFKPMSDLTNNYTINNALFNESLNNNYKFFGFFTKDTSDNDVFVAFTSQYIYDLTFADSSYYSNFSNQNSLFGLIKGDTYYAYRGVNCSVYYGNNYSSYKSCDYSAMSSLKMQCYYLQSSAPVQVSTLNPIDNIIYTNLDKVCFYDSNGDTFNINISDSEEPIEEPTEEPTNETIDLTFTNNLLFYICFILTLSTLYALVRNIFVKEW